MKAYRCRFGGDCFFMNTDLRNKSRKITFQICQKAKRSIMESVYCVFATLELFSIIVRHVDMDSTVWLLQRICTRQHDGLIVLPDLLMSNYANSMRLVCQAWYKSVDNYRIIRLTGRIGEIELSLEPINLEEPREWIRATWAKAPSPFYWKRETICQWWWQENSYNQPNTFKLIQALELEEKPYKIYDLLIYKDEDTGGVERPNYHFVYNDEDYVVDPDLVEDLTTDEVMDIDDGEENGW